MVVDSFQQPAPLAGMAMPVPPAPLVRKVMRVPPAPLVRKAIPVPRDPLEHRALPVLQVLPVPLGCKVMLGLPARWGRKGT